MVRSKVWLSFGSWLRDVEGVGLLSTVFDNMSVVFFGESDEFVERGRRGCV